MRTGNPPGWLALSRRSVSLVIGTVAILGLIGCSGTSTLTPTSVPVEATAAISDSAPGSTTNPTSASQGNAVTGPKPTADIAPTLSATEPTLTVLPDTKSETPMIVTTQPLPTAEIAPTLAASTVAILAEPQLKAFPLPTGSRPHDVAPALDGGVWYTAQGSGALGWLDPETGHARHTPLGSGSRPHGVIVGPDGAPWITDSGLNAIVRVDPESLSVDIFPLPPDRPNANLNTATFDNNGVLWFTGQNSVYGRLNPGSGEMKVFDAPGGRGPYGISASPDGYVYYASLAGSYVGRIDIESGEATVLNPPTPGQGARRVWPDSQGRIWVSEWNAGQVALYDPSDGAWREWKLPGPSPRAYSVYVDERDMVWLSDFGSNSVLRFDPISERFEVFALPSNPSNVRQILGRDGEVWLPESAGDQLVRIRY